jgi:hypothetical protein
MQTMLTKNNLLEVAAGAIVADPFPETPKPCLVIGTFAAIPYIHLQLESRRRNYPHVPVLIHDDASPRANDLLYLCKEYGAEFSYNETRQPSMIGDLTAFVSGFLWAKRINATLLVKFSRRFLPVIDWTPSLLALAQRSQYCTFSEHTRSFGFGFRTECVGMAVQPWVESGNLSEIAAEAATRDGCFVEAFIHQLAWRLTRRKGKSAAKWDAEVGERPADRAGYAPWDFMGTDRETPNKNFLWHNSDQPWVYHRLATQWGLPYTLADFQDPNQGFGDKPEAK